MRRHIATVTAAAAVIAVLVAGIVGTTIGLVGQARQRALMASFPGVALDEKGLVIVDPSTGRTGNPKVYAGGDMVSGGLEVVNAAQDAKRAVRAMCAALGIQVRVDAPVLAGHS